jgi:hypothetical protein
MSSTGASAAARLLLRAQLVTVKSRRPQNSSSRRRQNRTALKSLLEPVDPALPLADIPSPVAIVGLAAFKIQHLEVGYIGVQFGGREQRLC